MFQLKNVEYYKWQVNLQLCVCMMCVCRYMLYMCLPNLPINLMGIYYLAIKYAKQLLKCGTDIHTNTVQQQ